MLGRPGRRWLLAAAATTSLLAACGGGGGGSAPASTPAPPPPPPPPPPPVTFSITAKVAGATVPNFAVGPGQSATLDIASGQTVELTASGTSVAWVPTLASVTASSTSSTVSQWTSSLESPTGGSATLAIAATSDASRTASVAVNVAAHRYERNQTPPAVGHASVWNDTTIRNDNSSVTSQFAFLTTAVAANGDVTGTYLENLTNPVQEWISDADGNRLSRRTLANNNLCTFTPKRHFLDFPLHVGKTWSSVVSYNCQLGYHETLNITATVEAYEPAVTIPTGTYPALRMRYVVVFTNSNDFNLTNGNVGTGNATYRQEWVVWWAIPLRRTVKFDVAYTYFGVAPPGYIKSFTQSLATP